MSILKRTKNMIEARVSEIRENMRDHEAEFEEALESMRSVITDLEKSAASALTDIKLTKKQIEVMEGEKAKWLKNAKRAVGAGQDDLARQALLRKKSIKSEIEKCSDFLNKTEENYRFFKKELAISKEKYHELCTKLNLLKHNIIMEKAGVKTKGNREDEGKLEYAFDKLRNKKDHKPSIDEEFETLKLKLKEK